MSKIIYSFLYSYVQEIKKIGQHDELVLLSYWWVCGCMRHICWMGPSEPQIELRLDASY